MQTTPLAKEQKQRREAVRSIAAKNHAIDAEAAFQERLIGISDALTLGQVIDKVKNQPIKHYEPEVWASSFANL